MNGPAQGHALTNGQKGEYLLRDEYGADKGAHHGQKHQSSYYGLNDPVGGIVSPENVFAPSSVEDVVQHKQEKHPYADPLVGGTAYQFKSHKQ